MVNDHFHLLRLRLLKPPPSWINLRSSSASSFDLAVGLQDDYGVDIETLGSIAIKISIRDSITGLPIPNLTASFSKTSPISDTTTIDSSLTRFHSLSITLKSGSSFAASSSIQFVIAGQSLNPFSTNDGLSSDSMAMLRLIAEENQTCCSRDWDEVEGEERRRYIFMAVSSGDVELICQSGKKAKISNGNTVEREIASTKVPTILRHIVLPSKTESIVPPIKFTILEIPSLNNSTGQRLWDCAIGLSLYLSLDPYRLSPIQSNQGQDVEDLASNRDSKRIRLDTPSVRNRRSLKVLELGAGCGLVSMVASSLLSTLAIQSFEVIASDVEVTVDTSMKDNLALNALLSSKGRTNTKRIRSEVLQWGKDSDEEVAKMMKRILNLPEYTRDDLEGSDLTILASDVCYNPSFHQPLLETLLIFLRPLSPSTLHSDGLKVGGDDPRQALIAYKHRTEGDADLFRMASEAGLRVGIVWEWGTIQIWRIT